MAGIPYYALDGYLVKLLREGKSWALAWMDLSSGRFLTRLLANQTELEGQLERLLPTELLISEDSKLAQSLTHQPRIKQRAPWHFEPDSCSGAPNTDRNSS